IIINRCIVKSNPRAVQAIKEIYRDGIIEEVPGNGSITVWAAFDDPVTTVNDIIVKVWGAWGNRDARLSDLSVVQQNRVFDNLSRGRMEITRNDTTGGLIIYLPLRKSSFFAKNTKKNERAT
ncbi:hypothetical protein LCGC14_1877720, partial [marine sediment metagenome]